MAAIVFPSGHLLQAESVSKESCRVFKVVHCQNES